MDVVDIDYAEQERRDADMQRSHHMLARAPADRSWRRRSWLVVTPSCRGGVRLASEGNRDGRGDGGGSSRHRDDASGDCNDAGDQARVDLERLVGRVVDLHVKYMFRS